MIDFNKRSIKLLENLLRMHFPHKHNLSIINIEEIKGGWETDIFSLRIGSQVTGKPSSDELIVRFFPGSNGLSQSQKEFVVMQRLHVINIPVPTVELLVTDDSPFGVPFIVMEKIMGHTLAVELRGYSQEQILPWIRSSASLLHELHEVPWQNVIQDDQGKKAMENDPLALVKTKLVEMRLTIERFQLFEFAPFLEWLEQRVDYGTSVEFCLMHNDYHPENLIFTPGDTRLTILDWSFAEIGDFRLDLAWSVLLYGVMLGERYRKHLISFYEQFRGRPIYHLEYFEVLKFTERILTIATWLDPSVRIPVDKITRDAIRGDYKIHVLNVYRRLKEILGFSLPTIENL